MNALPLDKQIEIIAALCEGVAQRAVSRLTNTDRKTVARLAMALMGCGFLLLVVAGFSTGIAALFAIMFGAANGVVTIARGALPLSLFGPVGYGRVVGRIARPAQICQALSPFVLAYVIDRWSDRAAIEILIAMALMALICFSFLRRRPK